MERYLRKLLPVVAGGARRAEPGLTALDRVLAQERPEQGGFPRSVASDAPPPAGSPQRSAEPLPQRAAAARHARVLCRHHLIATPFGHLEPQRHRAFGPDHRAESRQPLEAFAPALGLFAVLARDVARDVVLFVRDGPLLLLERPLLRQPALRALCPKKHVSG